MSEAYVPSAGTSPAIHSPGTLSPQTIYETLVGVRDARQRRRVCGPGVAHYGLDRSLRGGRVTTVTGRTAGDVAFLTLVVAIPDGTVRAVSVMLDRTAPAPVVSAVVL